MCGFAGILNFDGKPVDVNVLARMGAIMQHRGPDDSGIECVATEGGALNLGVSFQRLAIIDLSSAGHQPMWSADKRHLLVFNGEIYNAPELRTQLREYGADFRGNSDTEVILALYQRYGEEAFSMLNGMFALSLWDCVARKLYLVRDRIGIKPLYYAWAGNTLVFASEIKALFCHPSMRRMFDPVGVQDYLTFQFCLGEETVFEGVKLLSPGSVMTYDLTNRRASRRHYWRWQYQPDHRMSLDQHAEALRSALIASLKRQTQSDVPVGTFLSSGMDTGAISALAVRHLPGMHSFTCGFDTKGITGEEVLFDERELAQALATSLRTEHHTLTLPQTALNDYFAPTAWHMESPQVGISYQLYAMASVIKPYCTVVLSGTGGDELFAGYHWRYQGLLDEQDVSRVDSEMYRRWCRLLPDDRREMLMSEHLKRELQQLSPRSRFDGVMAACDSQDALSRLLHFELHGFLHGLLQLDDKLNMAHSIESRVPLLDNEVLDVASRIPAHMKYDGATTKIVLKKALEGILPDEVIHRRKQGFTPPDAYSMRHVNRPWVEEVLFSGRMEETELFERASIRSLWQEHLEGNNHRFLIWALLCLHAAHEFYIEDGQGRFSTFSAERRMVAKPTS